MLSICDLYKQGRLCEGIALSLNIIEEKGISNSQYEIFLLAQGLYAGGLLIQAYHWIKLTQADPINRIPLQEKIERKLNL